MKKTQQHSYKTIDFPPLTDEQKKELEYPDKMPDSEIDYSDIPEHVDTPVVSYYFKSLKVPKTDIHTKIDNDNLARLKQGGRGYQARFNNCPIIQM